MSKSQANLNDLDLSKEQLLKLFAIAIDIIPLYRHDALAAIPLAETRLQLLMEDLASLKMVLQPTESQGALDAAINRVAKHAYLARTALTRLRSQQAILAGYGKVDPGSLFVSKPVEIVEEIERTREPGVISVEENSPRELMIIYPRNILYGILLELTDNARKSAPGRRAIVIEWEVRGERFKCEVHDDGPGIDSTLGLKFAPLQSLSLKGHDPARGTMHGLRIVERLIVNSNGMLLFSNSERLGGALVRFEFPIVAYRMGA
jgi:K+-sensing histidine kinase KdpD